MFETLVGVFIGAFLGTLFATRFFNDIDDQADLVQELNELIKALEDFRGQPDSATPNSIINARIKEIRSKLTYVEPTK